MIAKLNPTLILCIAVVLTIIIVAILLSLSSRKRKRCSTSSEVKNVRSQHKEGEGFLITWDSIKGAKSYNIYVALLSPSPIGSLDPKNKGDKNKVQKNIGHSTTIVDSVKNVTSPYLYTTEFNPENLYLGVTSVLSMGDSTCESQVNDSMVQLVFPKTIKNHKRHLTRTEKGQEAKTEKAETPVLRCYDFFEFPNEGGFQVKTCSSSGTKGATRLFVQWFPVSNVNNYFIYLNRGFDAGPTAYTKKVEVQSSSYSYETENLDPTQCWSIAVTSVNKTGNESEPSKIYSNCQEA